MTGTNTGLHRFEYFEPKAAKQGTFQISHSLSEHSPQIILTQANVKSSLQSSIVYNEQVNQISA